MMKNSKLSIHLLGVPQVEAGGAAVTFPTRKAAALLYYLAVARGPVSRERLVGLFFPEVGEKRARAALRQTIYSLKRSLPDFEEFIVVGRNDLLFDHRSDAFLDVVQFDALLRADADSDEERSATAEAALSLYRGDFLEGFYVPEEEFHRWHDVQREHYRAAFLEHLRRLLHLLLRRGEGERALRWAHRALEMEPGHEEVHLALMRYYASAGRKEMALRQFEQCRRWLQKDLGLPPAPALVALRDELLGSQEA